MNEEEILDAVVIGGSTDLSAVACWLDLNAVEWCIVGGMAVDSYAPPAIYSDRLDIAADREPGSSLLSDLSDEGFAVRVDARRQVVRLSRPGDGHRLQIVIHYGPRLCSMPGRAARRVILGRALPVAALADVAAALLALRSDPGAQVRAQVEAEMHLFRLSEQHAVQVDALLPADLRERAVRDRDRQHALACAGGDGWGESPTL